MTFAVRLRCTNCHARPGDPCRGGRTRRVRHEHDERLARAARWSVVTAARRRRHDAAKREALMTSSAWVLREPSTGLVPWSGWSVLVARHRPTGIAVWLESAERPSTMRMMVMARKILTALVLELRRAPVMPVTVVRDYDGDTWDGEMPSMPPSPNGVRACPDTTACGQESGPTR